MNVSSPVPATEPAQHVQPVAVVRDFDYTQRERFSIKVPSQPCVICHVLTGPFWPERGGMEDAIARITGILHSLGSVNVRIYVRLSVPEHPRVFADLPADICYLDTLKGRLLRPMAEAMDGESPEEYRLDYLLFQRLVIEQQELHPADRHVIFSFFISSSGFTAQHVASELGLPHVALCQGSDVSVAFHDPRRYAAVQFVLDRATVVVAICQEQGRMLRRASGRPCDLRVINNSIDTALPRQQWVHRGDDTIRLFSDVGFDHKKGTHLLLASFAELQRRAGSRCRLLVVGRTNPKEEGYWRRARLEAMDEFGDAVEFREYIPRTVIFDLILQSDIYCSPTYAEGCSLARLSALALGAPIVTTRCAEMLEIPAGHEHIALVPPAHPEAYTAAVIAMDALLRKGPLRVDPRWVAQVREQFSYDLERSRWMEIIEHVGRS